MSNRSPGPWTLTETRIFSGDRMVAEADRLANARLIAAAPELMEAAVLVIRLHEEGLVSREAAKDMWRSGKIPEAFNLMRAAIAKAEGTA
jgi:hypothetical protein